MGRREKARQNDLHYVCVPHAIEKGHSRDEGALCFGRAAREVDELDPGDRWAGT